MKKIYFLIMLSLIHSLNDGTWAQQHIDIHFDKVIKKGVKPGVGSANLCWLTDSDLKLPNPNQSFESAVQEMGMGSLRFPYGHLADNYLWHTPPYDDTENGLRPKVAAFSDSPYGWEWATNKDGSFKAAMDFDEYMQICQRQHIKPLVVINVFSFKYDGGPSYEELKTAAVEWVRYAKKKNYEVAYWQIGNEIDHHRKLLSMDQYVALYQDFTAAMKAVNPNIKTGPGILSNTAYYDKIVLESPELIDFTSCHQYLWGFSKSNPNYSAWKKNQETFIPNVEKMQQAVSNSAKPDIEIVITETGVTPIGKGMGDQNNAYKALWFFEMLMNEASMPNVAYSYFWGIHSPWNGYKDDDRDMGVLLRLDDNSRKPIADAIKLVNDNILSHLVKTDRENGFLRTYASKDDSGKVSVFIVNRNDKSQPVVLKLNSLPGAVTQLKAHTLKGDKPTSREMHLTNASQVSVNNDSVALTLEPLSITVVSN